MPVIPSSPSRELLERVARHTKRDPDSLMELVSPDQAVGAAAYALLDGHIISGRDLAMVAAHIDGYEFVDLRSVDIPPDLLGQLTLDEMRRLRALPCRKTGDTVSVAIPLNQVANLTDPNFADRVRKNFNIDEVSFVVAWDADFTEAMERNYLGLGAAASNSSFTPQVTADSDDSLEQGVLDAVDEDSGFQVVLGDVLATAIVERGTDIHIEFVTEGSNTGTRIRVRVDGLLRHLRTYPFTMSEHRQLMNVVKALAFMDPSVRTRPQDGRFVHSHSGRNVEVRAAIIPTVSEAEKAVLRVLDSASAPGDLADLGFSPQVLTSYESVLQRSSGLVVVTGVTGSGKTTTLNSTIRRINSPETHVVTVEDPVEYRIPGATQVQISPASGLGWEAVLRSVLRLDPDIVLIGEIRDRETAQIAVEAALTGHLVFSTLHTRSAVGAIGRLIDMGIEPYLVGASLSGVLAQRLVRHLCPKCQEEDADAWDVLAAVGLPPLVDCTPMRGAGCSYCRQTGFRGRLGVHEFLPMNETIRSEVGRSSETTLEQFAREAGWAPLVDDGLLKVRKGITSVHEVVRLLA